MPLRTVKFAASKIVLLCPKSKETCENFIMVSRHDILPYLSLSKELWLTGKVYNTPMISSDILIRISTILLHIIRFLYWYSTEKKANKEKPINTLPTLWGQVRRVIFFSLIVLLFIQLIGFDVLRYSHNSTLQITGLLLTTIGIVISVLGRKELGTNWTHGANYQIKNKQELVTSGIYSLIRHPIYAGLILAFIGGELVAESYLAFVFFVISFFGFYYQCKKEEEILIKHFGDEYVNYMKKTKMLVPYVL